jgi:hypothetical protein
MEKTKIKGRIYGTLTGAQKRRLKKVRELIAGELPDLIRRNQRAHDARKERTFSGALRRAIHEFPSSPMTIAERAGISWADLDDFLTGEKTLSSDAIDRLVRILKLKLPMSKLKPPRGAGKAS